MTRVELLVRCMVAFIVITLVLVGYAVLSYLTGHTTTGVVYTYASIVTAVAVGVLRSKIR